MTRTAYSVFAAFGFALAVSGSALASGEQSDFETCLDAIEADSARKDASFVFKSMRGNSLRSLTFEVKTGDAKEAVICKVKRGAVVDLDWVVS